MVFWIVNFVSFCTYGFIMKRFYQSKKLLLISCVHIAVIMGLRSVLVGTDTYNYAYAFNAIKETGVVSLNHVASRSGIFVYLLRLFSFLPRTQGYMIGTSAVIVVCLYYFIKEKSSDYYESIYIFWTSYLMFNAMNTTRHFVAMALIYICFVLLDKRKFIFSILLFGIACLVHNAVSVFVIFYFVYFIKWSIRKIILFSVCSFLGMQMMPTLINIFIAVFPNYAWLRVRIFDNQYISGGKTSMVYSGCCLLIFIIYFVVLLKSNRIVVLKIKNEDIVLARTYNDDEMQTIYKMSCLMIFAALMLGMYPDSILISRCAYVFFGFIVILLPNAINCLSKKAKKITKIVYVLMMIFMFLQLHGNYSGVLNYSFGLL